MFIFQIISTVLTFADFVFLLRFKKWEFFKKTALETIAMVLIFLSYEKYQYQFSGSSALDKSGPDLLGQFLLQGRDVQFLILGQEPVKEFIDLPASAFG